jgi:hypothetical protein
MNVEQLEQGKGGTEVLQETQPRCHSCNCKFHLTGAGGDTTASQWGGRMLLGTRPVYEPSYYCELRVVSLLLCVHICCVQHVSNYWKANAYNDQFRTDFGVQLLSKLKTNEATIRTISFPWLRNMFKIPWQNIGLENPVYGRRGTAALPTRHSSIRKSWH